MSLNLNEIDQEIARYVAAGGKWLLVTERMPELLRALRETRTALREVTLDEMSGIPDLFYPRGGWEAWDERARTVLDSVVDGGATEPDELTHHEKEAGVPAHGRNLDFLRAHAARNGEPPV
jgi:hypothetical protein